MDHDFTIDGDEKIVVLNVGDGAILKVPFKNRRNSPRDFRVALRGSGEPFATVHELPHKVRASGPATLQVGFRPPASVAEWELSIDVAEDDEAAKIILSRIVRVRVELEPLKGGDPSATDPDVAAVANGPATRGPEDTANDAMADDATKATATVKDEVNSKGGETDRKPGRKTGAQVQSAVYSKVAPPPTETPPLGPEVDFQDYEGRILRLPEDAERTLEIPSGKKGLIWVTCANGTATRANYGLSVRDLRNPTEPPPHCEVLRPYEHVLDPRTTIHFAVEIAIPAGRDPVEFEALVRYGRIVESDEGQSLLETVVVKVVVSPEIAVSLKPEKLSRVSGPFKREVDFDLTVGNAGNTATAYRIMAKDGSKARAGSVAGNLPDLPEQDGWRFLFTRPVDNVAKGGFETTRLRLLQSEFWWLGFWQRKTVTVVATPVTDPRNAGLPGNVAELSALRWRLWFHPTPWYLALPALVLAYLVLFAGLGIGHVRVDNAIQAEANRLLFVLPDHPEQMKLSEGRSPTDLTARLSWNAPLLSWLKVEADSGKADIDSGWRSRRATAKRRLLEYSETDRFFVKSVLGRGSQSSGKVVFLPMRTTDKLSLDLGVARYDEAKNAYGGEGPLPTLDPRVRMGDDPEDYQAMLKRIPDVIQGQSMEVVQKTVRIGANDRLYIYPANESDGNKVKIWAFTMPKSFNVGALLPAEESSVNEHSRLRYALTPRGRSTKDDDLWLLTSDSKLAIVHLKILRDARSEEVTP